MLDRLNGWQRIGVVITSLWLIFILIAGGYGFVRTETGSGPFVQHTAGTAPTCKEKAEVSSEPPPQKKIISFEEAMYGCVSDDLISGLPEKNEFKVLAFVVALFLPPLFIWLFVYLVIVVFRWVAKGFTRKQT